MSRVHTAWLKAQIESVPMFSSSTWVTTIPDAPKAVPPFVVIHPSAGTDTSDRKSGPALTQNPRWTIHFVGEDGNQAVAGLEMVKKHLVVNGFGVVPEISGEVCQKLWWSTPPGNVQVDTNLVPWVTYAIAECGFESNPA